MRHVSKIIGHLRSFVRGKKKALWISFFNAILLTALVYILNNQALFTGENLDYFTWIQWLKDKVSNEKNDLIDDKTFYINVGYDKELVTYSDAYDMELGSIPVTDRDKLYRLLKMLNETRRYKFIFLDISFEKNIQTETDSTLFSLLSQMPNLVIATYDGLDEADGVPKSKTALSQYYSTIIATNFVRYKFSYDGIPSIPLYAYRKLKGKDIEDKGLYYSSEGQLSTNSVFLDFPSKEFPMFDYDGSQNYYNLGTDILEVMDRTDIEHLTDGKYVIIGDFINDVHDTYVGRLPGAVITYRAFDALMQGKHLVSLPMLILFALIYFLISMSLFSRTSLLSAIPFIRKSDSRTLHFIASLIEYTFLLSVITILMCLFFNVYASILVPSIYFTVFKTVINYKRHRI